MRENNKCLVSQSRNSTNVFSCNTPTQSLFQWNQQFSNSILISHHLHLISLVTSLSDQCIYFKVHWANQLLPATNTGGRHSFETNLHFKGTTHLHKKSPSSSRSRIKYEKEGYGETKVMDSGVLRWGKRSEDAFDSTKAEGKTWRKGDKLGPVTCPLTNCYHHRPHWSTLRPCLEQGDKLQVVIKGRKE